MKLIITRHASTAWSREPGDKWQGSTDNELSDEGLEQARKLARRLKEHKIERIYTSPLKRARQTAEEIRKCHPQAELVIEDGLKEIDFGIFEGLTTDQIKQRFREQWEAREGDKWHYRIPEGESYADVEKRAIAVLERIMRTRKDSVIVAHATINKVLFMRLMGKPLEEISRHFLKNTGVSIFNIKGDDVFVEEFNCGRHLD